jgi:pimeloyl-ACP methyl ester carboxylesterase
MDLIVDGIKTYAATGGREHDPALPLVVFVHGAALDHTVWALLARWFAHRGWGDAGADLPGHGRSGGRVASSIAAMADWTAALSRRRSGQGHDHRPLHGVAGRPETAARIPSALPPSVDRHRAAMPVSRDR